MKESEMAAYLIWVTLWIVKLVNAIFCEENLAIKMRIEAKK